MKPAQWKTETKKQIDMTSIQSHDGVVKCVKFRSPASEVVLPSQTLLFYRPQTLEGEKRDLYVLLKFYKFLVDADITSFLVTFIIISSTSFSIILMFRSSG